MTVVIFITSLLFILAAVFRAVFETLLFRFPHSVFRNLKQEYWNPAVSHVNKWKNGNIDNGEKFPGSSTIFVFTTDALHLTKFVEGWFLAFALALPIATLFNLANWGVVLVAVIAAVINDIVFQISYSKLGRYDKVRGIKDTFSAIYSVAPLASGIVVAGLGFLLLVGVFNALPTEAGKNIFAGVLAVAGAIGLIAFFRKIFS